MNDIQQIRNRMLGCLYGQAVGNALGLVTEFVTKEDVQRMYPGGLSTYPGDSGLWEDDDTKQTLCLLDELTENKRIAPRSLARRLTHWLESDGRGCGNHVYQVITHRDFLTDPFKASYDRWMLSRKEAAPNGGIMRTAVVGLMPDNVEAYAVDACKVTHYDPRCIGSCVIASRIIHSLAWNDREMSCDEIKAIARKYDPRITEWVELARQSADIAALELDEPHSIGYTLRTLAAVLWCYWHAGSFEEGLLAVVNEGGDADTNAAVACAVLGAKFGYSSIPEYYIKNLHDDEKYRAQADRFIDAFLPDAAR